MASNTTTIVKPAKTNARWTAVLPELAVRRKNVPANIALSAAPLIIKTWTITGAAVPYGAGLNKTAKFKEQQTKEKDDEQEV